MRFSSIESIVVGYWYYEIRQSIDTIELVSILLPSLGDTVRVGVPQVDCGKTDARNIFACVMEVVEYRFFTLGTCDGILKQL